MEQLTRELFLSGVHFKLPHSKFERFRFDKKLECLLEITGLKFNRECHNGNIDKVTKNGFRIYSSIAGKSVTVWRSFADYVIAETQAQECATEKV